MIRNSLCAACLGLLVPGVAQIKSSVILDRLESFVFEPLAIGVQLENTGRVPLRVACTLYFERFDPDAKRWSAELSRGIRTVTPGVRRVAPASESWVEFLSYKDPTNMFAGKHRVRCRVGVTDKEPKDGMRVPPSDWIPHFTSWVEFVRKEHANNNELQLKIGRCVDCAFGIPSFRIGNSDPLTRHQAYAEEVLAGGCSKGVEPYVRLGAAMCSIRRAQRGESLSVHSGEALAQLNFTPPGSKLKTGGVAAHHAWLRVLVLALSDRKAAIELRATEARKFPFSRMRYEQIPGR